MNILILSITFFLMIFTGVLSLKAQEMNSFAVNSETSAWQDQAGESHARYGEDTLKSAPVTKVTNNENWWEVLGYEQLNDLVELALAENYQLATVQSQVKASEARVRLSRASLYPSVSFNPSFYRQEFSGNRPMPFDVPVDRITYNTYSLPLDLTYEVDVFGRNRSQLEASRFNLQASAASQEAAKLDVASAVSRNFVLLLSLDSEIGILNRTREAREENLEIVSIRYEAGLTNEIDLQRAKTELSSVEIQIKNVRIERREVELQLATLTGQSAAQFAVESEGIAYFAPEVRPLDDAALTLRRPDLQAAQYAVEAYQKQIKSARKNLYPSLYVTGSAGLLAGTSEHIFEGESRNWLLGASLSVPLFEGGRRQALLDISEHQLEGAVGQLKQNEIEAGQQVALELSDQQRLAEQWEDQQAFLAAARRAAELSRPRYKKGLVTYLEVVDADRIVLEAERLSIQLLGQQLLNSIDLITAAGGDLDKFEIGE